MNDEQAAEVQAAYALVQARGEIERLRKIIELDEQFAKEVGNWLGGKKSARNLGVVYFEHMDALAALQKALGE